MESKSNKLNEEQEFYHEVDKERRGSCCTCQSMLLGFLIILVSSVIINYFFVKNWGIFKGINWGEKEKKEVTMDVPAARKDAGYAQSVTITQNDLHDKVINSKLLVIPLSDKQITILPDGIYCGGKVPVAGTEVEVKMVPKFEGGRITIDDITVIKGPASFGKEFSNLIKEKVAEGMNKLVVNKMTIEAIELKKGEMIVKGN